MNPDPFHSPPPTQAAVLDHLRAENVQLLARLAERDVVIARLRASIDTLLGHRGGPALTRARWPRPSIRHNAD